MPWISAVEKYLRQGIYVPVKPEKPVKRRCLLPRCYPGIRLTQLFQPSGCVADTWKSARGCRWQTGGLIPLLRNSHKARTGRLKSEQTVSRWIPTQNLRRSLRPKGGFCPMPLATCRGAGASDRYARLCQERPEYRPTSDPLINGTWNNAKLIFLSVCQSNSDRAWIEALRPMPRARRNSPRRSRQHYRTQAQFHPDAADLPRSIGAGKSSNAIPASAPKMTA